MIFMVMVPNSEDEHTSFHEVALGDLKRKIVGITPGQKIAYVADCCYTRDNVERIVTLAQGADLFFCEAAFLEEDSDKARDKGHLTARQAGLIAREAGVKLLQVFHFSPAIVSGLRVLHRKRRRRFKAIKYQVFRGVAASEFH